MAQPVFGINTEIRLLGGKGFHKGLKGALCHVSLTLNGETQESKPILLSGTSFEGSEEFSWDMPQDTAIALAKEGKGFDVKLFVTPKGSSQTLQAGNMLIPFPAIADIRRGIDPKHHPVNITEESTKFGDPSLHIGIRGGFMQITAKKTSDMQKKKVHGVLTHARETSKSLVVAKAKYKSSEAEELSFAKGDIIEVLTKNEDGWWKGRHLGTKQVGLFPSNFTKPKPVEVKAPRNDDDAPPSAAPGNSLVKVKARYTAGGPDEMTLVKGDLVEVTGKDDSGWWTGLNKRSGEKGVFPSNFVKPYDPATDGPQAAQSNKEETQVKKEESGQEAKVHQQLDRAKGKAQKLRITKAAYKAADDDELTFAKGEVIEVLEEDDDGWWTGRLVSTGAKGTFPENFTRPYEGDAPVAPAKKSEASKTEAEEEDAAAVKLQSAFRGHAARKEVAEKKKKQKEEEDAAATKLQSAFRGHTARKEVAAKKSEKAKTDSNTPASTSQETRVQEQLERAKGKARNLRITKAGYKATEDDELTFSKGDIIEVTEEDTDGWWSGRNLSSGKSGQFPENYTKPYDGPAPEASTATDGNKEEEDAAAVKLQSAFRGHAARKEVAEKKKKQKEEEDAAATKLQSAFRGHTARQEVAAKKKAAKERQEKERLDKDKADRERKEREEKERQEKEEKERQEKERQEKERQEKERREREEEDAAAVKLQSAFRGHTARKEVAEKKQQRQSQPPRPSAITVDSDSSDLEDFDETPRSSSLKRSSSKKEQRVRVQEPGSEATSPKPTRESPRDEPSESPKRTSSARPGRPASAGPRGRAQQSPMREQEEATPLTRSKSGSKHSVVFEDDDTKARTSPPRRPQSAMARSPARGGTAPEGTPPRHKAARPQSATARSPAPRSQSRPQSATARSPAGKPKTTRELYGTLEDNSRPARSTAEPKQPLLDMYDDDDSNPNSSAAQSPARRSRPASAGPGVRGREGAPTSGHAQTMPARQPSPRANGHHANGTPLPRSAKRPASGRAVAAPRRTAVAADRPRPSSARLAPAPPSSTPGSAARRPRPTTSAGGRQTYSPVNGGANGESLDGYSDSMDSPHARPTLSAEERERILPQAVMLLTKAIHYGDARYLEATVDILNSITMRAGARQRQRESSESPMEATRRLAGPGAKGKGHASSSDPYKQWLRRKKEEERAAGLQKPKIRRMRPMSKRAHRKAIQQAEKGWDSRLTTPSIPGSQR